MTLREAAEALCALDSSFLIYGTHSAQVIFCERMRERIAGLREALTEPDPVNEAREIIHEIATSPAVYEGGKYAEIQVDTDLQFRARDWLKRTEGETHASN